MGQLIPRKLYHGNRIEIRDIIKEDGLFPRVDLYESVDAVLEFIPTPCDVYEIKTTQLIRKKFTKTEHPLGTLYSYHDHISYEQILSRVTYR